LMSKFDLFDGRINKLTILKSQVEQGLTITKFQ